MHVPDTMHLCSSRVLFPAILLVAASWVLRAQTNPVSGAPAANANVIRIPLSVTGPTDEPVPGLEQQNFNVLDGKNLQPIVSFTANDAPASIGIVVDVSKGMSDRLAGEKASVIQFIRSANPQDEFFLVGFSSHPAIVQDFTTSPSDILAGVSTLQSSYGTATLDALYFAVKKMNQAKYTRRALLVVANGNDERSEHSEADVRTALRKTEIQMYAIGIFDPHATTMEERNGPHLLDDLSNDTGGRLFQVEDVSEMGILGDRIGQELRHEYILGIQPDAGKPDGKWRKLTIRLNTPPGLPQLTVHARTGYYAPLP
jgi:Ca-activated chloride channel homolog